MDNFPIGTYVELLPDRETVYDRAVAGSRGWVRAIDVDEHDFAKVFIEWDKNHWRYNDQEDLWTFASHFKEAQAPADLTTTELDTPNTGPCPDCGGYHDGLEDDVEQYIDSITEAFDAAAGSDGFLLISLRREVDPVSGFEVFVINTNRGAVDEALTEIPMSEILRFVQEQKRMRGD